LRIAARLRLFVLAGDLGQPRRICGTAPEPAEAAADQPGTRMNTSMHCPHRFIGPALLLLASALPAAAQTATPTLPFGQTSALPPPAASSAAPSDPNAPRWILLEGYDRGGHVSSRWWLVRPSDFDVTNYHGFHTGTN